MRLGWDHESLNAPELARRAEAEGAAMVAVHGRTRNQFYKGEADWAAIRAVVEAVNIPVVANGDCRSAERRAQNAGAVGRESGDDRPRGARASPGSSATSRY